MSGQHTGAGCLDDRTNRKGWHAHMWADGFGRWCAEVRFGPDGYAGDPSDAAFRAAVRRFAREGIRRAITARTNVGPGWVCAVEPHETHTDPGSGVTSMISYRERNDDV